MTVHMFNIAISFVIFCSLFEAPQSLRLVGIDMTILVEDELDAEIVRLVLAAADRRAKRNAKRVK